MAVSKVQYFSSQNYSPSDNQSPDLRKPHVHCRPHNSLTPQPMSHMHQVRSFVLRLLKFQSLATEVNLKCAFYPFPPSFLYIIHTVATIIRNFTKEEGKQNLKARFVRYSVVIVPMKVILWVAHHAGYAV
jgi:hypothetical protein